MRNSFIVLTLTVLAALPLAAQDKKMGYLRTKVDPWVAGVFVDGDYKGTAAMFGSRERMIELKPGVYTVKLVDPRYKTREIKVEIEAGLPSTIRTSMVPLGREPKPPFGELVTEGFGNSAIYLNGDYYANTSEISGEGRALLLKPDTYKMKIVSADEEFVREENIVINADETLILSRTAAPVRRK